MRLNPFNTGNINVRSSGGGGFPGGGAGGLGCGTIVIAAIGYFVFGLDPMQTAGMVEGVQQREVASGPVNTDEQAVCTSGPYATEACNALQSLNQTWAAAFENQGLGEQFRLPTLDLFRDGRVTTEGCGSATSAVGPFYCPADEVIYIDTSFYEQLDRQLGAAGDFARYYVLAHEYGHHVQNITGVLGQIQSAQQQNPRAANQLQVLVELQADCYAGVWAGKNRNLIEPGDIEEGMTAAAAIGDDALSGGRASSESFTHGTSEQRSQALRLGLQGDDRRCEAITQVG